MASTSTVGKNILPRETADIMWDSSDCVQSLREVRKAVEQEAQKAIDWYWRSKRWKATLSRQIQLCSLILTAVAGIAPIVIQLLRSSGVPIAGTFDSGVIA